MSNINKTQFKEIVSEYCENKSLDLDFLFDCFEATYEEAEKANKSNLFGQYIAIKEFDLILYIVNEYTYLLDNSNLTPEAIRSDSKMATKIVSFALDKYFTNEHFSYENKTLFSKYNPAISTLSIVTNYNLNVLAKLNRTTPKDTLLLDIIEKSYSITKAILDMLMKGFATEAFSTWRTLHESESILILLNKYGEKTRESYLKHIQYVMAFRGVIKDKDEVDQIFVQIKDELHSFDLKSKDTKKFIEYGWLTSIPDFDFNKNMKLNFRDGIEACAGLSNYSKTYEMASEISHSSPMLIYSDNVYFLRLTLILLYESFFRIDEIFKDEAKSILKNEQDYANFLLMRKIYYSSLKDIYQIEKSNLNK